MLDHPTLSLPALSVLMAVHNTEAYLPKAVESILNQTFADFEFIIVDDGSTDGSTLLLESYARCDSRIKLITLPSNGGLINALNLGAGLCNGRLIARMDADDISLPCRFAVQVSHMNAHPECSLCGSLMRKIDADGIALNTPLFPPHVLNVDECNALGMGSALGHPSFMFRREHFIAIGGYRFDYKDAEDLDLLFRIAQLGSIDVVDQILVNYRVHNNQITTRKSASMALSAYNAQVDAYRTRTQDLRHLPFAQLNPGYQYKSLDAMLAAGKPGIARLWAWRAFLRRPGLFTLRQMVKALRGKATYLAHLEATQNLKPSVVK